MRSVLAIIILSWGAVYGYAAFYGITLWRRRPQRREYLTFGLMALALVILAIGSASLVDAPDLESGDIALRMRLAGSALSLAFMHHFAVQLAGLKRPRLVRTGYVFAGVCTALIVLGIGSDAEHAATAPTWGFAAAPDYFEPRLDVTGTVLMFLGWALVASTIEALVRAGRQDGGAKLVLWAFIANCLAVGHDYLIQFASLRSVYLAEHAAFLTILAVARILLDRFTRTNEELDLRTRQLSTSYEDLRHTEAELVKKEQLAAVGELSGLIARQVETPLETIKTATSKLRQDASSEEGRRALLGVLDGEVDRLNRLVDDLLAYARPVKPQTRPVAIEEMARECLSLRVHPDSKIEAEIDLAGAPKVIYGDGDLLRSALDNVIQNAVEAMANGGRITIRARSDAFDGEPGVVIEVRDCGDGMDAKALARAREPFFTTRPQGTGLGLAIVDRVVKMHGGSVTVESQPERGTSVSIALPVGQPSSSITPLDDDDASASTAAEARP